LYGTTPATVYGPPGFAVTVSVVISLVSTVTVVELPPATGGGPTTFVEATAASVTRTIGNTILL